MCDKDNSQLRDTMAAAILLETAERTHKQTSGYGSSTVRGIAQSLRHNCIEAAQAEWYSDGDKLHQHPTLEALVISVLGCRLHFEHNCTHWICSGVLPKKD
jgi:hypothetical protein